MFSPLQCCAKSFVHRQGRLLEYVSAKALEEPIACCGNVDGFCFRLKKVCGSGLNMSVSTSFW